MNRRLLLCVTTLSMGLSASLAMAQADAPANPAAVAHIAVATKQSSAITPEQKSEIDAFVSAEVNILVNAAPAVRTAAKAVIFAEAPGSLGGYTPQYLDAFASALDQQILAALKAKPSLSVRLNLAVVAARVATNTGSFQLTNAAQALMQDESEAVALWGMRTAKIVLPNVIAVSPSSKLPQMMADVGLKYPGPVLIEAYQGLVLESLGLTSSPNADKNLAQIKVVVPFVQALVNKRIQTYGASAPKDPYADTIGTWFLSLPKVWEFQSEAQKKETLKVSHDLLSKLNSVYTESNDELLGSIKRVTSACGVTAGRTEQSVKDAADKIAKLSLADPPAKVKAELGNLITALEPLIAAPAASK